MENLKKYYYKSEYPQQDLFVQIPKDFLGDLPKFPHYECEELKDIPLNLSDVIEIAWYRSCLKRIDENSRVLFPYMCQDYGLKRSGTLLLCNYIGRIDTRFDIYEKLFNVPRYSYLYYAMEDHFDFNRHWVDFLDESICYYGHYFWDR